MIDYGPSDHELFRKFDQLKSNPTQSLIIYHAYNHPIIIEIKEQKSCSSHGRVIPVSWLNPNSSSALCNNLWNMGFSRNVIGMTYLPLLSPTYTAKCPLGTPFFFLKDEHLFRICLRVTTCIVVVVVVVAFLFVFHKAIFFF